MAYSSYYYKTRLRDENQTRLRDENHTRLRDENQTRLRLFSFL